MGNKFCETGLWRNKILPMRLKGDAWSMLSRNVDGVWTMTENMHKVIVTMETMYKCLHCLFSEIMRP